MKVKDFIKVGENFEFSISTKYYLFVERVGEYMLGKLVGENLLVEIHEHLPNGYTDFIETLNHKWTCDTDIKEMTFDKVKELASYVL